MPTPGDIAVLQFGADSLWHYAFLTPTQLSTLGFNVAGAAPVLSNIGTSSGCIPSIPIPLTCMDLSMRSPLGYDASTKQVYIDTSGFAAASAAITGASVNGSGHLILTQQSGSTFDAGYVIGSDGSTGATGAQGAAGATGSTGATGSAGTAATIVAGTVTALSAGATPTITNVGTNTAATFNFGIPAGATGTTGSTGAQGIQGATGATGSAGAAATIAAGTVTLLAAGSSPTVTNSGSSLAATFNFGLPYSPARTFNNAASHALIVTAAAANGFQVSSTQDAQVSYEVSVTTTATIGGSGDGSVVLEICSTNSATAGNWVEISRVRNSQTITLAIALNSVQIVAGTLVGIVPAGYYARCRSITTAGTVSFSANATGQEVLL